MKEIHTHIEIEATPERVWKILTNFAAYEDWNPFMRRASCHDLKPGEQIEIWMLPPGGTGWTFYPTLVEVKPGRELCWLGRFILPGVFDGEHRFTMEALGEKRMRFMQSERFRGLLVPILRRLLEQTQQGFEEMNRALKTRAESSLDV